MADAVAYRGMIIWVGVMFLIAAVIIVTIALLIGNRHLYVHPDVVHPVTLPVHWR